MKSVKKNFPDINLLKSAKDAAVILDKSLKIVEANNSMECLYGYSRNSLLVKDIFDLIPQQENEFFSKKINLLKNKNGILFESKSRKKDNSIFPIVISINPIYIERKKYYLCIIRDNTLYEKIINKKEQQINTYKKVADNFPDVICRLNKKHHIIYINPAIEQLFSKKSDEFLGKSFSQIGLTKKVSNNSKKMLSSVFKTGKENTFDFSLNTSQGLKYFNIRFIPEISSKGTVETVLGIIRDITEIKKLDEAKSVLASIVESSDDAIIAKTLSGKIVSWNLGAEKIYGYKAEEVINKNVDLIIPEDKKKEQQNLLLKVKEGKGIENYETERIRKDGTRINVSVTFSPINDKKGKATGISVIARDITRQKLIEKEYKLSEEKFRSIAENIQEVFYIRERDPKKRTEKMLYVSQAYEEIWQMKTSDLYENPAGFMDIILPEYHKKVKTALEEQWEGKQTDIVYCIKRKDNSLRWIRDKAYPVIDEIKNINKVIGVAEDISEKKIAEDKLKVALRRERKALAEIEDVTGRVAFLSEATATLNSSLDYKTSLQNLGKLLIPDFADWFIVDILENNGMLNHLTISHNDPKKIKIMKEFREKYHPGKNVDIGVYKVAGTKKSEFYPNIKDEYLKSGLISPEYRKLIKQLNLKSIMIIPLIARGIVLGAITLASSESKKKFHREDLDFAENLAQRAAIAIDNAILYRESKTLNERLEQRVKERTYQLEKINQELQNEISERKKIEEILREQAQVIDQIHDSVISTDLEGYVINWNKGSEKIFGYSAEEMINKHISKLFTKNEFNFLRDEIIKPLKEKGDLEIEVKLKRKSGGIFNGLLSLSILTDLNGKIRGMIGYTMDITERKKAEEALKKAHDELELRVQERTIDLIKTNEALQEEIIERRRAEKALIERDQRLRASLEASETGTFRWDIKTNDIELDENLHRMLGLKSELELSDLDDFIKMIHPDDLNNFTNGIKKCIKEGADFDMEYRIIWPDKSIHWLLDKGKTIKDENGEPVYMTGACVDITEMKAVKKERADLLNEIEKQRLRIDNIISTIPGVVWEAWGSPDEERQRSDFVNDYIETMLGYTTKEWLETPNFWLSIVHPDDKERAAKEARDIFNSGKGGTSQYRWIAKDGHSVWVESQSVVLKDNQNKPIGLRGVSLDINERKKAQQMIETSLREKEILLKEIHHRVKNNLQILSSLLNLQSNYMKDKHALEVFKESQNRIKSMALVHEKLYQSKDLFRIDFQGYVRDLTSNLIKSYRTKANTVKLNLEVEDIFLSIDEAITLGLIINELVSNSLKYAFPDGKEGKLDVKLKYIDDEFSELMIRDNGIGLPEGFNIKETETLGIQLVDTLTEQLDGEINIENKNGAEFKIKFPLHKDFE